MGRFTRGPGAESQFERWALRPVMVAIVGSLVLAITPLFVDLTAGQALAVGVLDWSCWGLLAAEFLGRVYLSERRLDFVRRNLIDLAVVALPLIPWLRALRLLRLVRVAVVGARVADQAAVVKRGNVQYALLLAALVVLIAGVLVWSVERDLANSDIRSLTDALWWALATVTTVGYGDAIPVSGEGRAVAVVLMVLGIAVFGIVSATLASLFVDNSRADDAEVVAARLERVEQKVDQLLFGRQVDQDE